MTAINASSFNVDAILLIFIPSSNAECNIDVKEATVVFMVDVGYNLPEFAVPNVKEFILSTLDVMELGRDRIQV